jgi:hypothetical protein
MKKIVIAVIAASFLAVPVVAQEAKLHSEVEQLLRNNGIEVTVPETATNEQLAQIIAVLNTAAGGHGRTVPESEKKFEVEKILGM